MSEYDRVLSKICGDRGWIDQDRFVEPPEMFFMSLLTDRISIRVTADQKQNLQKFCLENGVQQKKFVLRTINHALKNLQI